MRRRWSLMSSESRRNFRLNSLTFPTLQFIPWSDRGIIHGFVGMPYNFREKSDIAAVAANFKLNGIYLPKQVHGNRILGAESYENNSSEIAISATDKPGTGESETSIPGSRLADLDNCEGDGFVKEAALKGVAVAIKTADCVPLLMANCKLRVAIHAGWRGIAAGIVEKAVKLFAADPFECLIGPAAGINSYLFDRADLDRSFTTNRGSLVIADPPSAVTSSDKVLLGLTETVAAILKSFDNCTVFDCKICTITTDSWHSCRRYKQSSSQSSTQQENFGLNLAFIV
jgi:copper oxidase (laccase) domain-containing protein